ncbi:MAG: hypothetical protein M3362_16690 [Acidobacteriota bacterium]|nr:hypothetical protein [Acidobacteriota bacterium]
MKRIAISITFRLCLAAAVFTSLIIHPQLSVAPAMAAPQGPTLKSESQLRSEAELYDTAVREISRVADMKLATEEGSKEAQAILDRQIPNLRFGRSKLVVLGLSESSFVSAVRSRAGDKKSASDFAQELGKDKSAIMKLNGAQSVADRIRSKAAEDFANLRRVADQLKQVEADIKSKAKTEHAVNIRLDRIASAATLIDGNPVNPLQNGGLDPGTVIAIVIVVAMIACPPLLVAFLELETNPVFAGAVIFAQIVADLIVNVGTDEGRNKVAACQKDADAAYRRCVKDAKAFGPLAWAAADACYGQWLLDSASCVL